MADLETLVFLVGVLSLGQGSNVKVTRLSTVYLPTYGPDGSQTFPFPSETVEQAAVDLNSKIIYGVGNRAIHIIDADDANKLIPLNPILEPDLAFTDVEVCGSGVFVSYQNQSDLLNGGGVRVYRVFNRATQTMDLLHTIPMGSLPDMLLPTSDCKTIVVAVENEAVTVNETFVDPPGGVGIIRFPYGHEGDPDVKILGFEQFDSKFEELSQSGVRWVYRGSGNNFSNNVEPEYVTFSADYTKAYISLQENNAIAEVDLVTDTITSITGLGFKQWGELDASNRDGGISILPWDVLGMYQPDAIESVVWGGEEYLITANEGDAQEYEIVDFEEIIRGQDIAAADIASSVSDEMIQALQNDSLLGRLQFSSIDGKNSDGKFEEFYTYGGRGFSVWSLPNLEQVYDSGSEMEQFTAALTGGANILFNNAGRDGETLQDTFDSRSDNKGPETESVATGELDGRLLMFIGNEQPGTIAVYSTKAGVMEPEFETLITSNIPVNSSKTWDQLVRDREAYGLDPEFLRFFPASSGLAEDAILLMVGAVSGTVTLMKVEINECRISSKCVINQPCFKDRHPHNRQCQTDTEQKACLGNCRRYVVCANGHYRPRSCPRGQYFDESAGENGECVRGRCISDPEFEKKSVSKPSATKKRPRKSFSKKLWQPRFPIRRN